MANDSLVPSRFIHRIKNTEYVQSNMGRVENFYDEIVIDYFLCEMRIEC